MVSPTTSTATSSCSSPPDPPLWTHQEEEIEDRWFAQSRALLWSMRTGKTRTIIKTAEKLHRYGDLLGVLVMAPNGVHSNWIRRELPKWASPLDVGATWNSSLSRERDPAHEAALSRVCAQTPDRIRWLAVNDEALINERAQKAINDFRISCNNNVLLVADESSMFRRPGAQRTRIIRGLAQKLQWRRILDGTAIFNSPLHAFSQYEILQKGALGFTTFEDFKKRYAVFVMKQRGNSNRNFLMLDHHINMDELRERMAAWSSVVMREDCNDMPILLPVTRDVVMTERQVLAYRQMAQEMVLSIEDGEDIEAKNGGAKALKLQQILGGFMMDKRGDVVSIEDEPPILDALEREVVGTLPGKCIVWCRFKEDIRRCVKRLTDMGLSVVQYHGDVPAREREVSIDRFQNDPTVAVFVGQPQAGARGLDLSAADCIIWYSVTPDAIITEQGNERGTQVGGKAVSIVTLATAGTVHDHIVEMNEGKVTLADQVSGRGLRDFLLANRV